MGNSSLKIVVIGGGAAGYFAALRAAEYHPHAEVLILEKSSKILSKVRISGGGRCNVTNACFDQKKLASHYPRGEHFLRKAFSQFDAKDTINWFESKGVKLKTYPDNCIFPQANTSEAIIRCFEQEAQKRAVKTLMNQGVKELIKKDSGSFELVTNTDTFRADRVIITIGGQPKGSMFTWLSDLGLEIITPLPSLFTFNMPGNPILKLMGIVVENAQARIEGSKLMASGPLLITHWGMSGPAILKLSAWGARELADKNYEFNVLVNWMNGAKDEDIQRQISQFSNLNSDKLVTTISPFGLSKRLWLHLCEKAGVHPDLRWKSLEGKVKNKLVQALVQDRYPVSGKTTFKEEFVTAGGIALHEIDVKTMQSKKIPGLYFAGEVLDVDGITGGFNFQAAWTTGFIAGACAPLTGS